MSFGSDEKVHAEELAAVLVSWRGILLGVTLGEKPYGVIKVDFGRDAKVLEGIAKQFLLDALAKHGAMIDDLQEWNSLFITAGLQSGGAADATWRVAFTEREVHLR